jgi:hypothetical protein
MAYWERERPMLDDLATWAFWIGILLWQVAAIVSLWLWGGVKRSALGHLAAGILALVSGTLFIHVTVINVFARMDNAYLGNGIFGGYFIFAGVTLLLGALAGYGVYVWVVVLLWLGAAAFAYFGIPWLTNLVPFPDSGLLLFTMVLLIGVLGAVMARGYAVETAVSPCRSCSRWWGSRSSGGSMARDFARSPRSRRSKALLISRLRSILGHFSPASSP